MSEKTKCPLCDIEANNRLDEASNLRVHCPQCALFVCTVLFAETCRDEQSFMAVRHKLSGFFFEISDTLREYPPAEYLAILNKNILGSDYGANVLRNNAVIPDEFDTDAKILKLLHFMKRRTSYPGEIIDGKELFKHLNQILYAKDGPALRFLWQIIEEGDLIEGVKMFPSHEGDPSFTLSGPRLTRRALNLLSGREIESTQIFLALQFNGETHNIINDDFKKAIQNETGFNLKTVADIEHNNLIDDQIIAEINRSIAIIADFSEGNQGAYYEAGYAHGQGKELIFLCKKSAMEAEERSQRPHFDVNHRSFVVWESPEDLREKLIRRINATLRVLRIK